MLISAWMYAISGTFFLVAGAGLSKQFNDLFSAIAPSLPLYPLPPGGAEGGMWLALSVSMMAMITWLCRAMWLNPERNSGYAQILLLSKSCSAILYFVWFSSSGLPSYLIGGLTDGFLFIVTLALWIPASDCGKFLSDDEADILAAIGDSIIPPGGPVALSYSDFSAECVEDARRMLGRMDAVSRIAIRAMMRFIDIYPALFMLKFKTFRRLSTPERTAVYKKLEGHKIPELRSIAIAVRVVAIAPYFNRTETDAVTGYDNRGFAK